MDIKPINQMIDHAFVVEWVDFTEGDVLFPIGGEMGKRIAEFNERSVQVVGDFGTGGTVVIAGSNNPNSAMDDFDVLRDSFGVPLQFTDRDLRQIEEAAAAYAPKVTAGSGLNLTVRIFAV